MTHQEELLATMQRSRAALEETVAPYRGDLSVRPDGGWTVGETLAHIAIWERLSARTITGEEIPYGGEIASRKPWNLDAFNAAMRDFASGWTDEQILTEFASAHLALIVAVEAAAEDDCAPKGRVWHTIDIDSAGHYHVHMPIADEMAARWPGDVDRD